MQIIITRDFGSGFNVRDAIFCDALLHVMEDIYGEDILTSVCEAEYKRLENQLIASVSEKQWRTNPYFLAAIKDGYGKYRKYDYPKNATDFLVADYDGAETLYYCIDGKILEANDQEREQALAGLDTAPLPLEKTEENAKEKSKISFMFER